MRLTVQLINVYSTHNVSVRLTAQLKDEPDSSVDKCVKNVSHRKKHFFNLDALNTKNSSTPQKRSYLAVIGQSSNYLSNIYFGSSVPFEEEVEHLLPKTKNQNLVPELLLQVNDEVPEMLSTTSKVFREGKYLPKQPSNFSLESNSARRTEPVRKACSSPPRIKGNCPTYSKTTIIS